MTYARSWRTQQNKYWVYHCTIQWSLKVSEPLELSWESIIGIRTYTEGDTWDNQDLECSWDHNRSQSSAGVGKPIKHQTGNKRETGRSCLRSGSLCMIKILDLEPSIWSWTWDHCCSTGPMGRKKVGHGPEKSKEQLEPISHICVPCHYSWQQKPLVSNYKWMATIFQFHAIPLFANFYLDHGAKGDPRKYS